MSNKDIWFSFYINDYLGDTMHLTTEQHGAYFLLLLAYYRNGGPLPADYSRLAAITRLPLEQFKKHAPILLEFFQEIDGKWKHKRSDREMQESAKRKKKARNAIKSRWEGNKDDGIN